MIDLSHNDLIHLAYGVILVLLIAYLYIKDAEQSKKIRFIAKAMEDLNRDLFKLEKKVNLKITSEYEEQNKLQEVKVNQQIDTRFQDIASPMANSLQHIEESFQGYQEHIEERLTVLENGLKGLSITNSPIGDGDISKITALKQQGLDEEKIAKELRITKSEVDFALKLGNLS